MSRWWKTYVSDENNKLLLIVKGERFLATMVEEGQNFIRTILDQLTAEEIRTGSYFLQRVTDVLDKARAARGTSTGPRR